MLLQKLQLTNFRNYENQFFEFSHGLNCIIGVNGSGKTNLLDAIYFLSLGKSSIHNQDVLSIKFEEDYMLLEGFFENKSKNELISCSFQRGGKKSFFFDKNPYERISDHVGKYPVVLIAPDDTDLIRDGSETRRKLFDGVIAQANSEYLKLYQFYNRTLDQRNSLLKQFSENNYFDKDLLKIYSEQLIGYAKKIFELRGAFMHSFLPFFKANYQKLSENNEEVDVVYESELRDPHFESVFYENISRDLAAERTTKGIHKDDYVFMMNEKHIKKYGSQGQKKSFIMAIKLAQFELLEQSNFIKPILLLDDIFDKLDEKRISKLLDMIKNKAFGQIFLTDARPNRTRELMEGQQVDVKFINTVAL